MPDPSTPTHPRPTRRQGPTRGYFVDYGDRTVLVEHETSNQWRWESVTLITGIFGFTDEGLEKMPRPYVFDAQDVAIVVGDTLVIDFLNGDNEMPVIVGAVRALKHDPFLRRTLQEDPKLDPNRLRFRLVPKDAQGKPTGDIKVRMADDGTGTIEVGASHSLVLEVGADPDKAPRMRLTMDRETLVIERGGVPQAMILGESFVSDLQTFMIALQTFFLATSVAVTAPQIATAALALVGVTPGVPPFPLPVFLQKLTQSLAAGAPFLSTRSKTE